MKTAAWAVSDSVKNVQYGSPVALPGESLCTHSADESVYLLREEGKPFPKFDRRSVRPYGTQSLI